MAIQRKRPPKGFLFHSGQGSQYASHELRKLLKKHDIIVVKGIVTSAKPVLGVQRYHGKLLPYIEDRTSIL